MFHDTVMSLVVVCVIVALACIWKSRPATGADRGRAGSGKLYDEPADPGTINFVPRPDWYFYFLFYLLRIFKWPESVILGTVGIPTILLVILLALPFMDLRRERALLAPAGRRHRRDPRRALDGRAHLQGRDREGGARLRARRTCRPGRRSENLPADRACRARSSSRSAGCLNCHTYLGAGGAPTSARRT